MKLPTACSISWSGPYEAMQRDNMSVAVWVGLIALLGIDAETGVFMLLYLDLAYEEAKREGRLNSLGELRETIIQGAAKRLRPKFMTFATICVGLFPIIWGTGAGSDVMKRIAAPMVGGIFTSFVVELLVYPAIYEVWRWRSFPKAARAGQGLESLELQASAGLTGSRWMWNASIPLKKRPMASKDSGPS